MIKLSITYKSKYIAAPSKFDKYTIFRDKCTQTGLVVNTNNKTLNLQAYK